MAASPANAFDAPTGRGVRAPLAIALAALASLASAPLAEAAPLASAAPPATRSAEPDRFALSGRVAHLAQVVYPTAVRGRPGGGEARGRVGTEARWGGGPVRLLVLRSGVDRRDRRWLLVRLPERPNDRSGWIRADHARVSRTPWRVVVSTAARAVTVYRSGRRVRRFGAVVGAPATPTPRGLFAVSERIRQPAGGVLGPWALHLTAHSNVLRDYGGGPGRVAIHGRSGSLLADPPGSARSHGCIRVSNGPIRWLARRAIEGTPVLVRR